MTTAKPLQGLNEVWMILPKWNKSMMCQTRATAVVLKFDRIYKTKWFCNIAAGIRLVLFDFSIVQQLLHVLNTHNTCQAGRDHILLVTVSLKYRTTRESLHHERSDRPQI